jgi:hypothetical protein
MSIYIIYKTTNTINKKIYIGRHKQRIGFGVNDFDGYLGSGIALKHAINKYGKENFIRESLYGFNNDSACIRKEIEIVSKEFIESDDNYNLSLGGEGGWGFVNDNDLTYKRTEETEQKRINTIQEKYGVDNTGKLQKSINALIARNKVPKSKETRDKQSASLKSSKKVSGENNPMFGRTGKDAPCYGRTGKLHPMFGKNHTAESIEFIKQNADKSPKPLVECPHCKMIGGKPVMSRYHFDKCKLRLNL